MKPKNKILALICGLVLSKLLRIPSNAIARGALFDFWTPTSPTVRL